jgi:hypothetical protein
MPGFIENPSDVIARSRQNSQVGSISLRFPKSESIPYTMLLNFQEYRYQAQSSSSLQKIDGGTVVLPLPLQLTDTTEVVASSASLGILKAGIVEATRAVGEEATNPDTFTNYLSGLGTTVSNLYNEITTDPRGTLSDLTAAGGTTVGSILTGKVANPFETMEFKGVNLKKHAFNWRLSPSNSADSDAIKDIITYIKKNTLPSYNNTAIPGSTGQHALLNYPKLAMISFLGIDQNYYYRLKPAMITSFNVRYNGGEQLNVFKGGKPVVVELAMELTEVNIHTSEDYGKYSTDTLSLIHI